MRLWCFFIVLNGCFSTLRAQELSYDEVLAVTDKVQQEQRFVGALSESHLHSLPIGIIKQIGETRYLIAIDSAYFTPQGAYFHAYMAIEFPGTDKKIAFAARNIKFNPSGVMGGPQSRLSLVSDHRISISNQLELHLPPDGTNYVEWNCNGFSAINISGQFIFSGEMLTHAENQNLPVTAAFTVYAENIHEIITRITFDPFRIKGLEEWKFTIADAIVDWSSTKNHAQMIFPMDYESNETLWTGFWLKQMTVELPPQFSTSQGNTSIGVHNLLIDNQGVSGIFQANHVFELGSGDMSGWGFSLEEIQVMIQNNELRGGSLSGKINIPVSENNQGIDYSAMLFYNYQNQETDYVFSIQPANNVQFPVLGAEVDIYSSSQLLIAKQNQKFKPELILNGKIKFSKEDLSTGKLDFQQLTFITTSPYLINGTFSLSASENKAANYPISISSIFVSVNATAPKIGFDVSLNLMDEINQGISASSRIFVETELDPETDRLRFKQITIGNLQFSVNNSAFNLNGQIAFRRDDPNYGNGFFGSITFSVPNVLEPGFTAQACFGKTTFRYFAVDAFIPTKIPISGTPVEITRLMGGISYHMQSQKNTPSQFIASLNQTPGTTFTQTYYPNENIGIAFKAGASFSHIPNEKSMNGDAMLEMVFNSNGGLNLVRLSGNVYFMCNISDRLTKPASVFGSVLVQYDHVNRAFDANINASINVPQAVTGSGEAKIHFDPQTWLICVGRPNQPVQVNVINIANGSAYVMTGKQLEPMPPPPAPLNALVSSMGLSQLRNNIALENASGFACGFRISGGMYREMGWDNFNVYGSFGYGAGFDMMLANYGANAHCVGSNATIGMNGWMVEGQLFAYLQCNVGIAGRLAGQDFDFIILNGSVATLLGGKLPKPTYLYGGVHCTYTILNIINGSFNFQFESGSNCTIQAG